ncbi:hypothetical protein ABIE52_000479 [Rhodococcus sp. OAS809]
MPLSLAGAVTRVHSRPLWSMVLSVHAPTVSSGISPDRVPGAGDDVRERCLIATARHARQRSRAAGVPDDVDRAAQPVRIPERLWRSWLDDPAVVSRCESKRYRRREQCWPWIGGVSSTGHGSFRAASLPGLSRRGTVPAHLFAYQPEYGVALMAQHRIVDFAGCTNPAHMQLGTNRSNPWRIQAPATQHRQPTRRRSRARGLHSCHRRRDPDRDRTERKKRRHRRAHRRGRGCRTSTPTLVATPRCTFNANVFRCCTAHFAHF